MPHVNKASLHASRCQHVLVHVGYAIQKVSEEEAADSWQLFDEILAADA